MSNRINTAKHIEHTLIISPVLYKNSTLSIPALCSNSLLYTSLESKKYDKRSGNTL